mmetsp:Transcript_74511/g.125591  ORF Transcript_74511/g.125591 Transcript_74511/m.125591 type:complete len:240 (-) Transcript_74511:771-1490(-)
MRLRRGPEGPAAGADSPRAPCADRHARATERLLEDGGSAAQVRDVPRARRGRSDVGHGIRTADPHDHRRGAPEPPDHDVHGHVAPGGPPPRGRVPAGSRARADRDQRLPPGELGHRPAGHHHQQRVREAGEAAGAAAEGRAVRRPRPDLHVDEADVRPVGAGSGEPQPRPVRVHPRRPRAEGARQGPGVLQVGPHADHGGHGRGGAWSRRPRHQDGRQLRPRQQRRGLRPPHRSYRACR